MRPLPLCFLRGVRSSKWISEEGKISAEAFKPDKATQARRQSEGIAPEGQETSINWKDSDEALSRTQEDKNNAKYGVIETEKAHLDYCNSKAPPPTPRNGLFPERRPIPKNEFHGNIVFTSELRPHEINMYAGMLAQFSRVVQLTKTANDIKPGPAKDTKG